MILTVPSRKGCCICFEAGYTDLANDLCGLLGIVKICWSFLIVARSSFVGTVALRRQEKFSAKTLALRLGMSSTSCAASSNGHIRISLGKGVVGAVKARVLLIQGRLG